MERALAGLLYPWSCNCQTKIGERALMARMHRRNLFRLAGSLPALGGLPASAAEQKIVAVIEPGNAAANSAPVARALDQLRRALSASGSSLQVLAANAVPAGAAFAI